MNLIIDLACGVLLKVLALVFIVIGAVIIGVMFNTLNIWLAWLLTPFVALGISVIAHDLNKLGSDAFEVDK